MAARRPLPFLAPLALAALAACGGGAPSRPAATPAPAATAAAAAGPPPAEAVRRLNLGIALLEQHKFAEAEGEFDAALAAHPGWLEAEVDLAIARVQQVKYEEATAGLKRALATSPDEPVANYVLGLVHKYKGEKPAAIAAFEKVRAVDPDDIDTKFNLASLYKDVGRADEAIPLFEEVLATAPHFLSAWYGLGQLLLRKGQQSGDAALVERGKQHIEKFQRLSGGTAGETAGLRYGEQGRHALALEDRSARAALEPAAIRFAPAAGGAGIDFRHAGGSGPVGGLGGGVLVFDLDRDGDEDVVLAGPAGGQALRLYRNDGKGAFTDATQAAGLVFPGPAQGLAAGDLDGDGRPDLLAGGRVWLAGEDGKFTDASRAVGLAGALAGSASLALVDLDHDGDLDLAATFPERGGVKVWRNPGKGKLEDVTAASGFPTDGAAVSLVFTDFDGDRDIDGLVGVQGGAPRLLANDRELKFHDVAGAAGLAAAGKVAGVTSADLDGDGHPELILAGGGADGHLVFRNTRNRRFAAPVTLSAPGPAGGLAAGDFDLDGDLDLVAASGGGLRFWRNDGTGGLADETARVGLDAVAADIRGLAAGDLDGDGDLDLVGNAFAGPAVVLVNSGAEASGWLIADLEGTNSNRSGLGTKVEVHARGVRSRLETRGADGFLSQGPAAAHFGLAGAGAVDRVRLLWPGGVLQSEVGLAANRRHRIAELDRKGSSCPFLWAWNGREWAFVSDIQGASPLGLTLAPGMRNQPDPEEWFLLPDGVARPEGGSYRLIVSESLEEIAYLDRAMLRVVDAPREIRVHPNERLLLAPPFAPPGLLFARDARPPLAARDDAGADVREALEAIDGRHAGARRRAGFRGFAEPWRLELDFGTLAPAERGRPVALLAHGWIEFSNSTPMYAAGQAGLRFELPALDVLDSAGRVFATVSDAGAPAGLPKWMVLELGGKLPPDGRARLVYRTNMEVHFDQVLLATLHPAAEHRVTDVEAGEAELRWAGYPTLVAGEAGRPPSYRYDQLRPDETWTGQEGLYTRLGDVRELLAAGDDRLVVMTHGDEVRLSFPTASLPELPAGWERHLILYTIGWAKDLDPMSAAPLTVGPLPWRAMPGYPYEGPGPWQTPERLADLGRWSTRWVHPASGLR